MDIYGCVVFIGDVIADTNRKMNSEVYKAILSAQIHSTAATVGQCVIVQMNNDSKCTAKKLESF